MNNLSFRAKILLMLPVDVRQPPAVDVGEVFRVHDQPNFMPLLRLTQKYAQHLAFGQCLRHWNFHGRRGGSGGRNGLGRSRSLR